MTRIKRFSKWFKNVGTGEYLWFCYSTTPLLYITILWPLSVKFSLLWLIPVGFIIHMILVYWGLLQFKD